MNDSPEQDGLWELLGRGPRPKISPYFARNVLREIRQSPSLFLWPVIPRWAAAAAFAVLIMAFVASLPVPGGGHPSASIEHEAQALFEQLAGLHDLARIEPIGLREFAAE